MTTSNSIIPPQAEKSSITTDLSPHKNDMMRGGLSPHNNINQGGDKPYVKKNSKGKASPMLDTNMDLRDAGINSPVTVYYPDGRIVVMEDQPYYKIAKEHKAYYRFVKEQGERQQRIDKFFHENTMSVIIAAKIE